MLRRLFTFLFYCLFVLAVISVCLVLLFPRDRFLLWTSELIERKLPGIEIAMEDLKYVHPFKIRLYGVVIRDNKHRFELPFDTLLISIEPRYPIGKVGVVGVLFGGDLSLDVSLAKKNRIELANVSYSEMHLDDFKELTQNLDRPIKGIATISGRAAIARNNIRDITFSGKVQVRQFRTSLRKPILGQSEVKFDTIRADLILSGRTLDLTNGEASGPVLAGDFSGPIRWTRPWRYSSLELRGNIFPEPELLRINPELAEPLNAYFTRYNTDSIPYTLEGTISEPHIRLDRLN